MTKAPNDLADYHAVAGVAAYQVGDRPNSRRHFWAALRANPTKLHHAARFGLSYLPGLANRVWGRHG